jgi:hypothetical protein
VRVARQYGGRPVPGYQDFWTDERASLQAEYKTLKGTYPEDDTQYRQIFKGLCNIEDIFCGRGGPRKNGNSQRGGRNQKQLLQGTLGNNIV